MGCLRVDKIIDYLMEPLKKGLRVQTLKTHCIQDADPYVRKTAAICVAKVFDLNPSLAVENGLVTILQEMLTDKNPMVIANVVAAMAEISESPEIKDVFVMNAAVLTKLLAALNECTE
jgi:AP-1 complex subunit beta-1